MNELKNTTLISGLVLLVANILFGLILSIYPMFNMWINCGVIVAVTLLIYALSHIVMKDAFKISLSFLFSTLGFVIFIIGLLMPQRFEDNLHLLAIILIVAFMAIVLAVTNIVSKKVG